MTSQLLGLRVEGYKAITLVDVQFDPEGGVVGIMGKNEAGKSSLLDAFASLLSGRKGEKPKQPVKVGAERATIIGTFDDITVTRVYRPNGTPTISVVANNGSQFRNAEEVLSALYSHVALDPLAFSRLAEKDQVATLLGVLGVDPAPLDNEYAEVFSRRTGENATVRSLKARFDAMPLVVPNGEAVEVSIAALAQQLDDMMADNGIIERAEFQASQAAQAEAVAKAAYEEARARWEEAKRRTAGARARVAAVGAPKDPTALREAIAGAEAHNASVQALAARRDVDRELQDAVAAATASSARLEQIKAERRALLASAPMPVEGLEISEDGTLLLNGTAFADASTGAKIRTGTAIAMALNPALKAITIRDASLLDESNRQIIDELARANGFLVLCEFADTSWPVGVVIEDGSVAATLPEGSAS